jgi:pilus assembly protein CpaB
VNRRALLLVITGVVAAIAATVVIYFLITNLQTVTPPPPPPPDTERRVVIVAAADISPNIPVSAAQITTGTYPTSMLPFDPITSTADVISKTATTPILSGQILVHRQFADLPPGPRVNVPEGKVLVAFPSTDMLNATGAVQARDHVDIMLSIPISGTTRLDAASQSGTQLETGERALVSQMTLQNIIVENVGQWTPPGTQVENAANNSLKIITFIVEPQEALILKYVKDSGGTIDLAIRSALDNEIKDTDPVTLDYLVDLFGLIGLNQPSQPVPSAPSGNTP